LAELPFSSFCNTEKSVVPSAAGTTISPSMIAELDLMCQAFSATLLEAPGPVVTASRVDLDGFVGEMNRDAVAVELDLVDPPLATRHAVDRRRQRRFDEAGQGRLHAERFRFFRWKATAQTRRRLNCRVS
jgi:hypothetical protein